MRVISCACEWDHAVFLNCGSLLYTFQVSVAFQKWHKSILPEFSVIWNISKKYTVWTFEFTIIILRKKANVYTAVLHWGEFRVDLKWSLLHIQGYPCFLWFLITQSPTASFCTLKIQTSQATMSLRPNKAELHSCDFINVSSKSEHETFY